MLSSNHYNGKSYIDKKSLLCNWPKLTVWIFPTAMENLKEGCKYCTKFSIMILIAGIKMTVLFTMLKMVTQFHNEVIEWKHFPHYWQFVLGIHWSPVNSPHKGQWRGALMFTLICAWINRWVNNREAGNLRHHRAHYDIIVMFYQYLRFPFWFIFCFCSTLFWIALLLNKPQYVILLANSNDITWLMKTCLWLLRANKTL